MRPAVPRAALSMVAGAAVGMIMLSLPPSLLRVVVAAVLKDVGLLLKPLNLLKSLNLLWLAHRMGAAAVLAGVGRRGSITRNK